MINLTPTTQSSRGLDFPELRAHVYFASPRETLQIALAAVDSSASPITLQRVSLRGDASDAAFSATVETMRISSRSPGPTLLFDALPLGPSHTRLVIRCAASPAPILDDRELILTLQAATDAILIGG